MKSQVRVAFVAMLLLGLLGVAYATDVVTKYPSDAQEGVLDSISAADVAALDSTSYSTRTVIRPSHSKNLTAYASFSSGGATSSIGIVRGKMSNGTFKPAKGDCEWSTFTADSTFTVGGRYVSQTVTFDTTNCDAAMLFVRSVSAGNVVVGWRVH